MTMPKKLIEWLKEFLSILFHNIFVVIVLGIIGVPTLISWVTGTLDILIQMLKSPTPLWATISLIVLCCLYTYVKIVKISTKLNQEGQSSNVLLGDTQVKIPSFLWKQPNKTPEEISESLKLDLEAIKFHLSELGSLNMLQTAEFFDSYPSYQVWLLDQEGRHYLIKHKIS